MDSSTRVRVSAPTVLSIEEQLYQAEANLLRAIRFYRQLSGSQNLSFGHDMRAQRMQCELLLEHVHTLLHDPVAVDQRKLVEWQACYGVRRTA